VDVHLLGKLEVLGVDGRPVSVRGGKQAMLLALLILRRNEAIPIDQLVDALWDDAPPATAMKNVQIYVSQLRKALGEATIATTASGYSIILPSDAVDVDRFGQLVERGRTQLATGDAKGAASAFTEALGLWKGPPLADFAYAGFAQAEIARLEEARLGAIEERNEANLQLGFGAELVPELESLVREHPLRERLREQLMLALYRSGRQADALSVFRDTRRLLVDELGIEPSRRLQDVERQILAQDAALDAPRRGRPRPGRLRWRVVALAAVLLTALVATLVGIVGGTRTYLHKVPLNSVAMIDPTTDRLVAAVPVGANAVGLTIADGSVWVINQDDRTLMRIDLHTRKLIRTIALDGSPTGIASGDGSIWTLNAVSSDSTRAEVTRVSPAFDDITERIPTDLGYGDVVEGGLAIGAGSVWIPDPFGDSTYQVVERIDEKTHRVLDRIRIFGPRGALEGATFGAGAFWIVDARGLVRLDPRDDSASIAETPGGGGIAVGAVAVWVGARFPSSFDAPSGVPSSGRRGYVAKIDLAATATEAQVPASDPVDVSVGAGGVWVANRQTRTVERINPETGARVATISVGNTPTALATSAGAVWVVVS
jgi:DNA-binding SARP family transcriptional activator/streptogramin lyase